MNSFSTDWIFGNEYAVCYRGFFSNEPEILCGSFLSDIFKWFRHLMNKRKAKGEINKETINVSTEKSNDIVIQIEDDEVGIETERLTTLAQTEKAYNEAVERIKVLEKEKEKASERISDLEKEIAKLTKKNKDIEQRSMKLTTEMSKRTEKRGNFENVNDEQNNSRLAQRFESLYSNKWVLVAGYMTKTFRNKTEVENISILTDLMKDGYQKCKQAADDQICNILQVKNKDDIPANEDISDFILLRRRYALKDSVKDNIKKNMLEKLLQRKDVCLINSDEKGKNVYRKLTTFLEDYLECCWLMTVSNPTMVLDFDVVGKLHTECEEHFKVYSTKKPVEDMTKVEGEICEVVWPCVQLEDESAIYMKGDVIVVKKGQKSN